MMIETDDKPSNTIDLTKSTSSDTTDALFTPEPKKRGRKKNPFRTRNKSLFTRIVKTDIRRDYPAMLNNCFNSHDPSLLARFLQKYCRSDMLVVGSLPKPGEGNSMLSRLAELQKLAPANLLPPPAHLSDSDVMSIMPPTGLNIVADNSHFYIRGLDSSIFFMVSIQQDTPDSIGFVKHVGIKRVLFDEGSVLEGTMDVRGTRLFCIESGEILQGHSGAPAQSVDGRTIVSIPVHFLVSCKLAMDKNNFITMLQHDVLPLFD